MKPELKKVLLLNLPYLFFVYLFDKMGAAVRLAPGMNASEKILQLGAGFTAAFESVAPSLHPADLLIGIAGAAIVRLAVYFKGKNAKNCLLYTSSALFSVKSSANSVKCFSMSCNLSTIWYTVSFLPTTQTLL